MNYNPYNAIKGIYDLKGEWTDADKNGDTDKKKKSAEAAKSYYDELRKNGYGDVADNLSKSSYAAAKSIVDSYKPQTVRTPETMVKQENENLMDNYKKQLDIVRDTNPFETAEGKAILAKYDLAALQGRDNAVASGGASNGGNIDSFAAANALRQQAALVSKGQDAVLAANQQKIDNAMSIMESMGVHIDRVYNQGETSKNNQVARDVEISKVTGVVPDSMSYASNPYFNSDGTLAEAFNSAEFDAAGGFQKIINDATEKLKTATNSAERANLEATIKYANQARAYKIKNSPAHSKWAHTLLSYAPEETADYKTANKTLDLEKYGIDKNAETSKYTTDANVKMNSDTNATNLAITNANNASNEAISKDTNATNLAISRDTNATNERISGVEKEAEKYTSGEPPMKESEVTAWADHFNNSKASKYPSEEPALTLSGKNVYKVNSADVDSIIIEIMNSTDLTPAQKDFLLYDKFGINEDDVYKVLNDKHYQ